MKKRYIILIIFIVLGIFLGGFSYWYVFMQPHRDMLKTKPNFELTAQELVSEFTLNENLANETYLGKVVQLEGTVTTIQINETQATIILTDEFFGVSCYLNSTFTIDFRPKLNTIKPGQHIIIRGQCDGFLTDVVISQAIVIFQK